MPPTWLTNGSTGNNWKQLEMALCAIKRGTTKSNNHDLGKELLFACCRARDMAFIFMEGEEKRENSFLA
jgi:hypothetical protein